MTTLARRNTTAAFVAGCLAVTFPSLAAFAAPERAPSAPAPPGAAAPIPLGSSLSGLAKLEYDSARILFDNADYAGALVKFQHAFELSSDPRLLWDMGACEKNLRHYTRVLRLVDRYLTESGPLITDSQRADAANVVQTVRALVSSVRLTVNVADASVFMDGNAVGNTPMMEPLLVDLGDRHLRVTKAGYKDQELVLHVVGASEMPVSLSLERQPEKSHLRVSASPSTANVRVDGSAVGTGDWQGVVAPGRHTIWVTASGMADKTTDVVLGEGESRSVDLVLDARSHSNIVWWIGGGILTAAALSVGGYFLFRPSQTTVGAATPGTISPYTISLPGR